MLLQDSSERYFSWGDDFLHLVDDAINGMNVSVEKIDGIDAVDVDAVRVFRTIYTKANVVHIGPSELSIGSLWEVCRLVELLVSTIDNAVVDYDFHEAVA